MGRRPIDNTRDRSLCTFSARPTFDAVLFRAARPSHHTFGGGELMLRFSSCDGRRQLTPRETELITRLHLPAAAEVAAP